MAKEMNMDTLVKKLKTVSNTQDSIPMLSLWIIHHKAHHKQIVETWLNMLKKSKHQHRLTLLYLCNDVVQNCTRKNAPIYKDSFSDVLAEAVTHLRDSSIKSNVQRVVKIWVKRSVFDTDFTDQLLASLITNTAPEKLRNKLLVEYKTSNLIDEIKQFKVIEDEIESDQIRLKAIRMDVSNMDAIRKLKDKIGGEKFSREFEESATQLELFLKRYESYIEGRKSLLDLLDHGTVYYHAQYHEAKIVVNAYKSFENRVKKMKRGVDKVKERFPPLKDSEQDKSHGEDMEMSDEDRNLDKKSNIISSIEPKHRKTLKLGDNKPIAIPPLPREDNNTAASVIKLFATGLESMKNSNENTAESLKRAMSGLVKRPGMRGATFSASSDTTATETSTKESFKIVRSVSETTVDNTVRSVAKDPSPPTGIDSPPSPTGSPELNISSPPRMQSLDSRLADLFNEDGTATEVKSQTEASESDSDSDTDLIKRANRLLDMKQSKVLPGLGDLDKVKEPTQQEQTIVPAPIKTENIEKLELKTSTSILKVTQEITSATTETTFTPIVNQAIPVIGGISRVAVPINDGSSTPTLDEKPYSPPASSKVYIPPPLTGSLAAPVAYGGDALSFLSKIMGNATKPDMASTENAPAPTAPPITQQSPITANTLYAAWPTPPPTWPPANTIASSTIASNLWSSPPPVPTLPPPPVFSWSSSHDQTLPPPPWQNVTSATPRPTQRPSSENPLPNTVTSITAVATVNSTGVKVLPPQSLDSKSQLPRSNFAEPTVTTAPPPAKKSKWDIKDTDYRSSGHEASASVISGVEKSTVDRRPNLITVSSTGPNEGNPVKRSASYPQTYPASPPKVPGHNVVADQKTNFNDVEAQNVVAKLPLSHPPTLASPTFSKRYDAVGNLTLSYPTTEPRAHPPDNLAPITPPHKQFDIRVASVASQHKHYDAQGHEIISPEATINQRIKEARLSASANPPSSRLEAPPQPFNEATRANLRFEKPPGRFIDAPHLRPRFENPSDLYHEGQRPRPGFDKPPESFGEVAHPRPRLERPQISFNDKRGHDRPDFKMENPHKPFQEMRHPFRARSPPPRAFRLPGPRPPPPVRRRSTNEMIDVRLAMIRDEQRREEELLRDVAMLDEVDRMALPRPWSGRPHPPHLRPHAPRGFPFRGMRPRMRF